LSEPLINQVTTTIKPSFKIDNSNLHQGTDRERIRKAAEAFEAIMLQQLLKNSSSKETRGMFGGGMGEEFFQDHLNQERSKAMVQNGGIGLADLLEKELTKGISLKPESSSSDKLIGAASKKQALKAYEQNSNH
jgi:Rod binding domain-containing protein